MGAGRWSCRRCVDRLEYQLEVTGRDGETQTIFDPGSLLRAPGAFGEKSVLIDPGYRPPAWLDAPRAAGTPGELGVRVLGRALAVRVWSPGEGELPLLVAHDGPEYDGFSGLTRTPAR